MTTLSFMIASFVIISISKATAIYFLAPLMMLFGFSWALAVSVFNGSLQADFPPHIRSRMIGVYTVFFACAQALGSYMGGILVQKTGLAHEQACIAAALAIIALYYAFSPFYFFRRQPHAH